MMRDNEWPFIHDTLWRWREERGAGCGARADLTAQMAVHGYFHIQRDDNQGI